MAAWKEEAWVVLFPCGVRLSAEGQGAMFHLFTSYLGASVVVFGLCWLGFVFLLCLLFVLGLHLGFFTRQLPGANRASLSSDHGSLDDRQSLERARHELKENT